MVVDVGPLAPNPLPCLGPWPCPEAASAGDNLAFRVPCHLSSGSTHADNDTLLAKRFRLAENTKSPAQPVLDPALKANSLPSTPSISKESPESSPAWLRATPSVPPNSNSGSVPPTPSFSFTQLSTVLETQFSFPRKTPPSERNVYKRCRPATDVDGPFTADLSSKKRRLRLHLVTSRLSQPYSMPATHILNREATLSGDTRFAKLAAVTDLARRAPNYQSCLLRRAAVLNCARMRAWHEEHERANRYLAGVTATAVVLYEQSTGARFVASPGPEKDAGLSTVNKLPPRLPAGIVRKLAKHSPPTSPKARAADAANSKGLPPSPRLKPLPSPKLGPSEALEIDVDDEEVAFPTSEHESRYSASDDLDDVYSDFGLIFGRQEDGTDDEDEEEYSYDEYLDELDGIPIAPR